MALEDLHVDKEMYTYIIWNMNTKKCLNMNSTQQNQLQHEM